MWTPKSLKRSAKSSIHFNYLRMVAMCIVIAFFAGEADDMLSIVRMNMWSVNPNAVVESQLQDTKEEAKKEHMVPERFHEKTNSQIVREFLIQLGYEGEETPESAATKGVFAGIFNSITKTGSVTFGILNMVNTSSLFSGESSMFYIEL